MSYTYTIGITVEEHDTFVKNSDQANLLQSSSWADVKVGWQNERLGFYKDGKLVAVAFCVDSKTAFSSKLYSHLHTKGSSDGLSRQRAGFFCPNFFKGVWKPTSKYFY